jgi:hypothetical protein
MPSARKLIIRIAFIILPLVAVNFNAVAGIKDYPTSNLTFTLPEHGELKIKSPQAWEYRYTTIDTNTPPFLIFYKHDKNKTEIFQLNISILWEDSYQRNIVSPEYIRSLVQETGEKILPNSDQPEITLEQIQGTNGKGYLFDLSDNNAGQGEYKFLTQGALAVGRLLLIFSFFSNDNTPYLRDVMLQIITSAKHQHRKDV